VYFWFKAVSDGHDPNGVACTHRAWVDDQEVSLTALEMRLLWTLYQRRGRVQSRGTLLDDVWDADPENNTRTVDTHVKRLREKLGLAGAYVETVRGIGYRFTVSADKDIS